MKDRRDFIEIEAKCIEFGDDDNIVDCMQEVASDDYVVEQRHSRNTLDIYFDTTNFDLLHHVASLRLRRRTKKKGWTANFKLTARERLDGLFLERREIVTVLSNDEALAYEGGQIPGLAASTAYRLLEETGVEPHIRPVLFLISWRRHYTLSLRSRNSKTICLLHVMVDSIQGKDARELDSRTLISTDKFVIPRTVAYRSSFSKVCEVEIDGRGGYRNFAFVLARKLIACLEKRGACLRNIPDKYSLSAQSLGIVHRTSY